MDRKLLEATSALVDALPRCWGKINQDDGTRVEPCTEIATHRSYYVSFSGCSDDESFDLETCEAHAFESGFMGPLVPPRELSYTKALRALLPILTRRVSCAADIARIVRAWIEGRVSFASGLILPGITSAYVHPDGTEFVLFGPTWTDELSAFGADLSVRVQKEVAPDFEPYIRGSFVESKDDDGFDGWTKVWPCKDVAAKPAKPAWLPHEHPSDLSALRTIAIRYAEGAIDARGSAWVDFDKASFTAAGRKRPDELRAKALQKAADMLSLTWAQCGSGLYDVRLMLNMFDTYDPWLVRVGNDARARLDGAMYRVLPESDDLPPSPGTET